MNTSIEEKIQKLPTNLQYEVEKFIDTLLKKQEPQKSAKLNPRWKGVLKNIKLTSVELQHKSLEWWGD